MTPDDMDAGPEIDAAVAETVMEVDVEELDYHGRTVYVDRSTAELVEHYSKDDSLAHEALEKMREKRWKTTWENNVYSDFHAVRLWNPKTNVEHQGLAPTFALAASRAMLKAEGWEG